MFKKLFGGSKADEPVHNASAGNANSIINSIQQLADQEESLEKRKQLTENKMEAELEKARVFIKAGKKPQALQCMKRKKLFESELTNLDNMIMRVMEQRMMVESQRTTVGTVSTMHTAAKAAKDNMKKMNIENVEKVMDEISETNDQMRAINDAFATPSGMAAEMDEDELMNELNEMEATELDKELLEPAPVPVNRAPAQGQSQAMPSAPTGRQQAPSRKTAEELELEALQAEMAL